MSFHHLDGFFCFTVLVSSENCFMFGINARLDGGFLAVLVGKNGNAAFEAFGRLGESGIVAIAVEDQVKSSEQSFQFYVPHLRLRALWQK
mgnify:CR=1 FL=1